MFRTAARHPKSATMIVALLVAPALMLAVVIRSATASVAIVNATEIDAHLADVAEAFALETAIVADYVAHLRGMPDPEHDPDGHGHEGTSLLALAGVSIADDPTLAEAISAFDRAVSALNSVIHDELLRVRSNALQEVHTDWIESHRELSSSDGMATYHGVTLHLEQGLRETLRSINGLTHEIITDAGDTAGAATRVLLWATPVLMLLGAISVGYVIRAAALRKKALDLARTIEDKDTFISTVSHELRTPLTAVLGFTEELRRSEGLDTDSAELMALAAGQAREMADLVEDLLVAARADLDTISITRDVVDLADLVQGVVGTYGDGHDVALTVQPSHAIADDFRVRQIVRNILTNAIRYGADPIVVRTGTDGPWAYASVSDRGRGVPLGHEDAIFLPYHSAHREGRPTGSVGLGLPLSRELAGRMGGELVYTRTELATIFTLRLPSAELDGRLAFVSQSSLDLSA